MNPRVTMCLFSVVTGSACYTYVPVEMSEVSPGATVRAHLTAEASDRLPLAVHGDRLLEGELTDRDGGAFTVSVTAAVRQEGFYAQNLHERVRLGAGDVLEWERRELSRSRTYLVSGVGAVAVLAVVLKTLSGKTGGSTIDRTVPGPSADRIPVLSVRIR